MWYFTICKKVVVWTALLLSNIESNTITGNRDRTSVHPPSKDTEEHNQTVPGKIKK
jgi:hypothetical protein